MDGTALYEAAAALFIAQLYGKNFSLGQVGTGPVQAIGMARAALLEKF